MTLLNIWWVIFIVLYINRKHESQEYVNCASYQMILSLKIENEILLHKITKSQIEEQINKSPL